MTYVKRAWNNARVSISMPFLAWKWSMYGLILRYFLVIQISPRRITLYLMRVFLESFVDTYFLLLGEEVTLKVFLLYSWFTFLSIFALMAVMPLPRAKSTIFILTWNWYPFLSICHTQMDMVIWVTTSPFSLLSMVMQRITFPKSNGLVDRIFIIMGRKVELYVLAWRTVFALM